MIIDKGDIIETNSTGRISLLLPNHLLLKLSEETVFDYHGEGAEETFGDLKN